jgi:hypothetical protein
MSIFQIFGGVKVIIKQRDTIKQIEAEKLKLQNELKIANGKLIEQSTKLYAKDQVIKEQCSENVELYAENKEYKTIFNKIKEEILQTNNYNSVTNIQNKLKSMLEVVSGKHF